MADNQAPLLQAILKADNRMADSLADTHLLVDLDHSLADTHPREDILLRAEHHLLEDLPDLLEGLHMVHLLLADIHLLEDMSDLLLADSLVDIHLDLAGRPVPMEDPLGLVSEAHHKVDLADLQADLVDHKADLADHKADLVDHKADLVDHKAGSLLVLVQALTPE